MLDRILRPLSAARAPLLLAALALLLTAPSWHLGLQADDRMLLRMVQRDHHPLSLFSATPEEITESRNAGAFAWWANPALQLHLIRPLTSLTHLIEFRCWPDAAWAMHLVNGICYALLVWVAVLLYRHFIPDARLAGLAALMFCVDDGHAPAIGWIASRNTLLAALFSMLALLAHVRAREARRARLHAVSVLCVALALASGEAGVWSFAYLLAYAWTFESGGFWPRLRSLLPQLAVFAGWAIVYVASHGGIHGSSWYRELTDPLSVLSAGLLDLPIWLAALLGPVAAGLNILVPAATARLAAVPLVLLLLPGVLLLMPRTAVNRFFAWGALLCLPPVFTTVPQDRLLIGASFGAFGVLAHVIDVARTDSRRTLRAFGHLLIAVHLVLAPLAFPSLLRTTVGTEHGAQAIVAALPPEMPRQVVLVNTPIELLTLYSLATLGNRQRGQLPDFIHSLYSGSSELVAERIAPDTLQLTAARGWGRTTPERIFCNEHAMPRVGSVIDLPNLQVIVMESNAAGMPQRVQFRFSSPLETSDRVFYSWQGFGPKPWRPPAIGERISLPALSILSSLER